MKISRTNSTTLLPKPGDLSSCGKFAPLPYDIACEIFLFLDLHSVLTMPRVNRAFYVMSNDEKLLKRLFYFHVPMAQEAPEIYEKISYKKFLTGQGWPILFAPLRITIPLHERVVILTYNLAIDLSKDKSVDRSGPGLFEVFFLLNAFLFKVSYTPFLTQKASRIMEEFQRSLAQDNKLLDQLENSLKVTSSTQRTIAESVMMAYLTNKIRKTKESVETNPRWEYSFSTHSILFREIPSYVSIPSTPNLPTLLQTRPLSESKRTTCQSKVAELKKSVNAMQTLISYKQSTTPAVYPLYKKIVCSCLLLIVTITSAIIETLLAAATLACVLVLLYLGVRGCLNLLRDGYQFIRSTLFGK